MGPKKPPEPEPVQEEKKEEPPPEILQGEFVFPDGSTYSGQYMKKGDSICLHGEGKLNSGPERYEGTFANGMYKVGTFTSCSGGVYNGNFRDNKYHGVGNYKWPEGREYRGTWKDGYMHGMGMFLNFSVGQDKRFVGFSLHGQFSSGVKEQEKAKKAFLEEYGGQCTQSASAALRDLAERATADGAPAEYLVPQGQQPEQQAEKATTEEIVTGPFADGAAASQALLQAFVARLAEGAEQPLEVSVYDGLDEKPRFDKQRLQRPQLQMVGQAVEFFAPQAEAGALKMLVLVNVSSDYDVEGAKWKLVHCEVVPAAS